MIEEYQNIDKYYVIVMSIENRVYGNYLSDDLFEIGVFGMENGKCFFFVKDNIR